MNAAVRTHQRQPIPLNALIGRSPANCRAEDQDGDLAGLAASLAAIKQLHPLLVAPVPTLQGKFWIDDGGRRWSAFKLLRDMGTIPEDHPIDCDVMSLDGESDGLRREISLAANVMRRELHPVDECEAYEKMIDDGMSVEAIARDFAVTTRQVAQRLRLTKLSPAVRAAWRAGKFSADVAAAFTAGADHAEQDAVLARLSDVKKNGTGGLNAVTIRANLRKDAMRADCREAVFVGLDAYAAAGGSVDDNLFEDFALCRDGALLKRLAREKLMAHGMAIIEKLGIGAVMLRDDIADYSAWTTLPREFTAAEQRKIDSGADYGIDLAADVALNVTAIARKATPAQMVATTLVMYLETDGPHADVGMVAPRVVPPREAQSAEPSTKHRASRSPIGLPMPPETTPGHGKPLLATIAKARTAGVVDVLIKTPSLAAMVAIAALQARHNCSPVRIHTGSRNGTAKSLPLVSFRAVLDAMLYESADAFDTLRVLAFLVAESIVFDDTLDEDATALLATVAGVAAPEFLAAARSAFDYETYIGAMARDAVLSLYEACGGAAADARKLTRDRLTAACVTIARDKAWLPDALKTLPSAKLVTTDASFARPLADAMDDAITGDDAGKNDLRVFLERECVLTPDGKVKAGTLFDRYRAGGGTVALRAFGDEIASLDIEKKRTKDGWHYLGIALREATPCS